MGKNFAGATKCFSRWLRQKLLNKVTPNGYSPIREFSPDDIFVVGYPKSGNTWFQTLVSGAVYGVVPEIAPMSVVQDLVPDVHAVGWYKRYAKTMFFKSHALPDPRYRRVIYLMRDGRDAMVSYLHHHRALEGQNFDFKEFMQFGRDVFPCKWHEHVEAWLANPYQAEMMVVRYEDLKADPVNELQRVCEFAGLQRSIEILELAAKSALFEKMQAKEINNGPFSSKWPKDKLFCRQGKVGAYREEMPREILEDFMQESEPVMRQCGYC